MEWDLKTTEDRIREAKEYSKNETLKVALFTVVIFILLAYIKFY